jgi:tellurite resistance protein
VVAKRTDADWILRAMIAVAAADDRLNAREVALIQKVYEEHLGRSVDVSGVVLAVQAYATKRDVLQELSAAAATMSRDTKQDVVRAAYLTLLADERVSEEERQSLQTIADALRLSANELEAILERVERSLGEEPL